jgi:hypothetical protein
MECGITLITLGSWARSLSGAASLGLALAHVYGQPPDAVAFSDMRLTNDEARRISKLIARLPELVELEQDRNKARSTAQAPAAQVQAVTIGDLIREGKLLEVHCGNCRPERHLYIDVSSLDLPKRMPVPEMANHLVCSVAPRTATPIIRYGRGRMPECQG